MPEELSLFLSIECSQTICDKNLMLAGIWVHHAFTSVTNKSPDTAKLNKVLEITCYLPVPFLIMPFTIFILHTEVKFSICPYKVAAHFKNGTKRGSVQNSCCLQSKMGKGRIKIWAFYPTLQGSRLAQMDLQLHWIQCSRTLSTESILFLLILPAKLKAKSYFTGKRELLPERAVGMQIRNVLNPKLT